MVTFLMTLTGPNPIFKVTAYLKSNFLKTLRIRDKVTIEHYCYTNRKPYLSIEWYHFQI